MAALPQLGPHGLFLRLWEAERMTPTVARHVLKLGWSAADEARMSALSTGNTAGTLSEAERREFEEYVQTGLALSILHSRARKVLRGRATRGLP